MGGGSAFEFVSVDDDDDKVVVDELSAMGERSKVEVEDDMLLSNSKAALRGKTKKEEDEEEESSVESAAAAAKKKKKKKQKQKEKAAAAPAAADDIKKKEGPKKMSKAVREMQEALARRKEAEERKKREEEERSRKEEEERRAQEELERQAEEAKRRKKEREKEKRLKKKQEGKPLTRKQKDEARRLEAMRKQFDHAKASDKLDAKPPIYQTNKSKTASATATAKPDENVQAYEAQQETEEEEEEKSVVEDAILENGMDDDDDAEWDQKSWDDVSLNIKSTTAFDDDDKEEEAKADSEPHPKPKATKSQDDESKKPLHSALLPKQSEENQLRSPICCIMGHVDSGKTKLLDCIRGTNVQGGEAGRGITQQIGATFVPSQNIWKRTKDYLQADHPKFKVPGLLLIDTPGHESFRNLRSRGSALCDIAVLVIDIMDGLKPQTIESLNLLKMSNTRFIIALNKVDKLYGWKACGNAPIEKSMKKQSQDVQKQFNTNLTHVITQLKEQGLNAELYYKIKKKEMDETFSIVPTSAYTGEGIPDLLLLLVQWTQKTMVEKLTFSDKVQCTVLEVEVIQGRGTTIDVILVNGVLHEGDEIVVCGFQGPIVTTIRALLTPHPMKEIRVKGTYMPHKEIKAAQVIKIAAQGLEHAIAGAGLYVVRPGDDLEDVIKTAKEDMQSVMSRIDKSGEGVYVQASTLGSLEAVLDFLETPEVNIPVGGIGIGPVHKKDVMKASVMVEKNKNEYATILAFDVEETPEARQLANERNVKIFTDAIIFHLCERFKAYIDSIKEERKREAAKKAVFPCILEILPGCSHKKDPIILNVKVLEGILKVDTPICIPRREFIDIGRVVSIFDSKGKSIDVAKEGQKVSIKIMGSNPEEKQKMYGRHFDKEDKLFSHISRGSIDALKAHYKGDLTDDDWMLVRKLKILFRIP